MEELENMREMWIGLNDRLTVLEEDNRKLAHQVMNHRYKTIRDKLIDKYRRYLYLEVVCAFLFSILIINNGMIIEKYRWVTVIYWFLFFTMAFIVDYILMKNLVKLDVYNSSITEIAAIAAKNLKIHKLWLIYGIPVAFGALILYALALNADIYIILGMIAGAVLGALIGFTKLRKIINYYRLLQTNEKEN